MQQSDWNIEIMRYLGDGPTLLLFIIIIII